MSPRLPRSRGTAAGRTGPARRGGFQTRPYRRHRRSVTPTSATVVQFPTPQRRRFAPRADPGLAVGAPARPRDRRRRVRRPGSGPGGRVSVEDVKKYAREQRPASGGRSSAHGSRGCRDRRAALCPDFSAFGPIERQPMSAVRRATAEHLTTAWTVAPHVTQFDSADVTDLEALRKRWQPRAEKAGAKLTVTAMLLKIVAAGLKAFPKLNASVDMQSHEVIYKQYIHLGVAADTDRGLVVPVLRDADKKSTIEIAKALGDLSARARDRKLRPEDMQGGTFTVTNLGGLGGKHFAPILNWPEVGILGVGRAAIQPVYVGDELKPRLMLPLALSYDHRLVDGADGTRFLQVARRRDRRPNAAVYGGLMPSSPSTVIDIPLVEGSNLSEDLEPVEGRRYRRRAGRLPSRVPGRRSRDARHADRSTDRSRRRLSVRRLHPVEGAATRRQAAQRGPRGPGLGPDLRSTADRPRQAARVEAGRRQEDDRRARHTRQGPQARVRDRRRQVRRRSHAVDRQGQSARKSNARSTTLSSRPALRRSPCLASRRTASA